MKLLKLVKHMLNEKQVVDKIRTILPDLLENANLGEINNVINEYSISSDLRADLVYNVGLGKKKKWKIIVEVKSVGQPRFVRMAAYKLKSLLAGKQYYYGMIAAPYISEKSKKICLENNVGFVDLSGNCLIQFGNIYISIEGRPNSFTDTRPLKMVFSIKSSRAIRLLLCNPRKLWYVKELSEEAGISIGQVSKLKERLFENEFIQKTTNQQRKKFYIDKPIELLSEWEKVYRYRNNRVQALFSLEDPKTTENKLAGYCNKNNIAYAFTMTSGANLVAPFLRYNQVFCYVKEPLNEVVENLKLKPVTSGQNVTILTPFDDGVFSCIQNVDGKNVVSDIQLYLDLKQYKKRGKEAAEFILNERIKPRWEQNQNI